MSDVRIQGVDKLSQRLKSLERKAGRKGALRVLRKGAPPIKREMKRTAPVRSGRLKDAIVTRRGKKNRKAGENVLVGPRGGKGAKGAPYAHIIELGSRGGTYTAKKGLFSVFAAGGGIIRVPQIKRRGVQARGFIEKAFKSKASEAERRIAEAVRKLVES